MMVARRKYDAELVPRRRALGHNQIDRRLYRVRSIMGACQQPVAEIDDDREPPASSRVLKSCQQTIDFSLLEFAPVEDSRTRRAVSTLYPCVLDSSTSISKSVYFAEPLMGECDAVIYHSDNNRARSRTPCRCRRLLLAH